MLENPRWWIHFNFVCFQPSLLWQLQSLAKELSLLFGPVVSWQHKKGVEITGDFFFWDQTCGVAAVGSFWLFFTNKSSQRSFRAARFVHWRLPAKGISGGKWPVHLSWKELSGSSDFSHSFSLSLYSLSPRALLFHPTLLTTSSQERLWHIHSH